MENWKPVYGYEGLYEISDKANIRSVDHDMVSKAGSHIHIKGQPMKTYVNENGYRVVRLSKEGKSKIERVHRLMMLTFVGPDPDRPIVNHKNGKKLDLDLSNLEWSTSSENNKHAIDTGLKDLNKIRIEYHVTIDNLDFITMGAKAVAKKLHQHGYFTDVDVGNLKAAITQCANKHALYLGILKVEKTSDPFSIPNNYHRCGIKGRKIYAELDNGLIVHAKGPAKLGKKLNKLGLFLDIKSDTLVKSLSGAGMQNGYYKGIRIWYK